MLRNLFLASILCAPAIAGQSELEIQNAIKEETAALLLARDFDALEKKAERLRIDEPRTPSGNWHIEYFCAGIHGTLEPESEEEFEQFKELLDAWLKAYPKSALAHTSYGSLYISWAWEFRGGGFAHTVEDEAWKPFRNYIQKARDYLEEHKSEGALDIWWYDWMITVARAQSWDLDELLAIFREGMRKNPANHHFYLEMAYALLPRWGGSVQALDDFANIIAEHTREEHGEIMYARIYWYLWDREFERDLFIESGAKWERMKQGFDELIERYPSDWNRNHYAYFACLAKDKKLAKKLIADIEEPVLEDLWGSEKRFNNFVAWLDGRERNPIYPSLFYAVYNDEREELRKLLAKGHDPNTITYQNTSIFYVAAINNRAEALEILLENGGDPKQFAENPYSSIGAAMRADNFDMVRMLVEHGANYQYRDPRGETLLHYAIRKGSKKDFRYLWGLGIENVTAEELIQFAKLRRRPTMIDLIRELTGQPTGIKSKDTANELQSAPENRD